MAHQFVLSSSCLVAIALAIAFEVSDGCDNGFIHLDALRTVATKISSGGASNDLLTNELRLFPNQNFTCNGSITSFLLGIDIRTGETLYPQVQIWRRTSSTSIREYMKVHFEEIRLDPGAFSPSGVFEYLLSTPINFQSGDILGVWQPRQQDSVVRIFYSDNNNSAPITYRRSSATNDVYNIDSGFSTRQDEFILISPVADLPCTSGFLSSEELRNKTYKVNVYEARLRTREQRVFPDVNFTCSGNLTKWIVGGEVGNSVGAELQIWRKNDGSVSDYTRVGYSVLQASDPENDDVYEYTPNPPLEFQEGDILGVYQRGGNGRMRVYYQETTGPPNYRRVGDLNTNPPVSSTLIGAILVTDEYDYPLVTVEISVNSASPATTVTSDSQMITSTTVTWLSQSTVDSSVFSLKATPTPPKEDITYTSASTAVSTSVSYSSVPRPTTDVVSNSALLSYITTVRRDTSVSASSLTVAQQVETGIIVIAAPVALVVTIIIIIIILIVTLIIIFTWWRRRSHKNTHSVQYPVVTTSDEIVKLQQNVCYMTTNNKQDKQQDYEIVNYKQIAMQPNASYVTYNNKNSKLHVHNCIPDEHEHAVTLVVSTPDISHTSTTDDPISLQQNVSYISMAPNKPDESAEGDDGSNVYMYADISPRCRPNLAALTMVQNVAYGTSSDCSS